MAENLSPEERLLRLIRAKGGKKEQAIPADETAAKEKRRRPKIDIAEERNLLRGFALRFFDIDIERLKFANRALIIAIGVGIILFSADIVITQMRLERAKARLHAHKMARHPRDADSSSAAKPYEYYADVIGKKNLFRSEFTSSPVNIGQAAGAPEDIASNLNLIGFISGEKRQAIIEDKKSGKTYFLYKGDNLSGCDVIDVLEDKVILEYAGRTVELRM